MIKNKKPKLIVGGCSYTYGHNKKKDQTVTWGEQLAKQLDMELVNTAANGSGNEFILNQISEAVCSYHNIGLVVAMWSEFERIDIPISPNTNRQLLEGQGGMQATPLSCWKNPNFYDENGSYWFHMNINILFDQNFKKKSKKTIDRHNEITLYLKDKKIYSAIKCLEKSLFQMMLFKQLAKSQGLKYMQCIGPFPFREVNDKIKNQRYSKAMLDNIFFNELDESNFIGFPIMKNIGGFSFDNLLPNWSEDNSYRISEYDSHPNTKGHKLFADYLYERYREIYKP